MVIYVWNNLLQTPSSITLTPSGKLMVGGSFSNGTYSGNAAISIFDLSGNGQINQRLETQATVAVHIQ